LQGVPPVEILSHRIVWSLLFLLGFLAVKRHWGWLRPALGNRKIVLTSLLTAVLLGSNWLVYIWGVNTGHIVETSLGYFINPLVSVMLGVIFLHEALRRGQWLAIGLAALGVLYLTVSVGALPWISLFLAFSFGFYGLIRKTAVVNSQEGLTLEMGWLVIPAASYLLYLQTQGTAAFAHDGLPTTFLLAFAGVATAVPLLLFAAGARLIPLAAIGFLQYLAPTLQFLIGVLVYGEAFTPERMVGFSIIWLALILYSAEGFVFSRRQARLANSMGTCG
ncbi:MAG TPA: EamA family transporter RarD, partial [Anaerolineae bacterium]|nr:EamA family transporter RarD [Anaerolineae bacterium]